MRALTGLIVCLALWASALPAAAGDAPLGRAAVLRRGAISFGGGPLGMDWRSASMAGPHGRAGRLRGAPFREEPTRFERSPVVRIAQAFIDNVSIGEIGNLRLKFKIILE